MKELKQVLDQVMQREIDAREAVGTVLLVYKDGEECYRGSFGIDSIAKKNAMTDDRIFRLFSMTKPVMSVALHQLLERGLLSKEDEVATFFPTFAKQKVWTPEGLVAPLRPITVRDLLNMTSGLEYPHPYNPVAAMLETYYNGLRDGSEMCDTQSICMRLGEYPLLDHPGARWNYGTSADILGGIVEVVTGKTLREYMRENILLPLGMEDTDFYVPQEKWDRYAAMYIPTEKGMLEEDPWFLGLGDRRKMPSFLSGGAGLVGTAEDYSRFARMLVNEGTLPACASASGRPVTILKPETIRAMRVTELTSQQMAYVNWESMKGFGYGNLMRVLVDTDVCGYAPAFSGEFGWDGWAGTYVMMDPTNQIVFVYMVQQANGSRPKMYNAIKQAIYTHLV